MCCKMFNQPRSKNIFEFDVNKYFNDKRKWKRFNDTTDREIVEDLGFGKK